MASANFMQRVGKSSCLRCEFETDESQSFEQQDAAMMAHLAEKHPDWMTDGGASILPSRIPKSDRWRIEEAAALIHRNRIEEALKVLESQ